MCIFQKIVFCCPKIYVEVRCKNIIRCILNIFFILIDKIIDLKLIFECYFLIHAHLWVNKGLIVCIFILSDYICGIKYVT